MIRYSNFLENCWIHLTLFYKTFIGWLWVFSHFRLIVLRISHCIIPYFKNKILLFEFVSLLFLFLFLYKISLRIHTCSSTKFHKADLLRIKMWLKLEIIINQVQTHLTLNLTKVIWNQFNLKIVVPVHS